MRLDDFDYDLPAERIAQVPIEPRDAARLLVDRGTAPAGHRTVGDLPDLLRAGDVLVVNTTRVIPARLDLRRRTGGTVKVTLLDPLSADRVVWEALVRPGRRMVAGEVLHAPDGRAVLTINGRTAAGDTFIVEFHADRVGELDELGEMPLPPYIATRLDRPERYQTVYADEPGSVAAPTAGLHLTAELLARLAAAGVEVRDVELVVGADTFRPVTSPDPREHPIHGERYRVPPATWEACHTASRVVAVGTTSVRALESAAALGELTGRTELFMYRGKRFEVVDLMLTNFHLPRTTLMMMIDAFIGPRWRDLYETALAEGYRFLSFGDAALLDRHAE